MTIPLPLHLFIHLILAVSVGYLIGRAYQRVPLGLVAGVLGGFFIDLDHVLEYLLFYGLRFNLIHFLDGREFLASNQIHLWFHAWEYFPVLILLAWWCRRQTTIKVFILALAVGGLIHLTSDSVINEYPLRNYSLIYRWQHNFSAPGLLSPSQYQKYLESRQWLGL